MYVESVDRKETMIILHLQGRAVSFPNGDVTLPITHPHNKITWKFWTQKQSRLVTHIFHWRSTAQCSVVLQVNMSDELSETT